MNFAKRASIAARHMGKHKTFRVGGGQEETRDEGLEQSLEAFGAYEQRVKTLMAMTMDARAQLAEAFLQLGFATQCFEELTTPEMDVVGASAATRLSYDGAQGGGEALAARAARSKVIAGKLQEAFHASFGEALQSTLLTPLEGEVELFEKTRLIMAKHHEAVLESQHYASKLASLQQKATSEKEQEKLRRNTDKAAEAANALNEARASLEHELVAHDATRVDILTTRVNELKGMLHRFCEAALTALGGSAAASMAELDRYNIYGDVNVESAVSKLRRGIVSSTRNAGRSADSVAMRLAHMKRHAATTFSTTQKKQEASTDDPLEIETNEMAARYEKVWSVLEKLPPILEALRRWYEAGLAAFAGVAGELAAMAKETDAEESKSIVLTFHATLDEVRAALSTKFVDRVFADVIEPLAHSLDEFKELPEKLRDRRVKGLEREHYSSKLGALEKRAGELAVSDKASDAAKEKANERWERNKTKASTADEAARSETEACKDRLVAFDTMFKSRVDSTATSLDELQRDFYLDFAARVASKLQLNRENTNAADAASASKLTALMAAGIITPNCGMTTNVNAAPDYQKRRSTSLEYSRSGSFSADPFGGGGGAPRPPPPPPPPSQYAAQPVTTPRPPPPAPPSQAAPVQAVPPYAPPQARPVMTPAISDLAGRKSSLTPAEAEQVRKMMMQQAGVTGPAPAPPPAFAIPQPTTFARPPAPPVPSPPPAPPVPSRAPPGMIQVKALYDFDAVQAGDLSFKSGDLILTDEKAFRAAGASGGWITGQINGNEGVFPSNYVEVPP